MAIINVSTTKTDVHKPSGQEETLIHETKNKNGCLSTLASITVEPAIFLYSVGHAMEKTYYTNMTVDKICLNHFGYSEEVCRELDSGKYEDEQNEVQALSSSYNAYIHYAESGLAIIMAIIIGNYSDARGRRLPIIASLTGCLLTALLFVVNAYFFSLPPEYLILCWIPVGLVGGNLGVVITSTAFLSATSSRKGRSFAVSSPVWLKYVCFPLGTYAAMLLFDNLGYVAVFTGQTLMYLLALIYLLLAIKEPASFIRSSDSLRELYSLSQLKKKYYTTLKPKAGGSRIPIVGHFVIIILSVFMIETESYYFLYTRKVFAWDHHDYNIWIMVDYLIKALGLLVLLPPLSIHYGLHDCLLGVVGGVSAMFFYVLFGAAPYPWVLYLASIVALCYKFPIVTSRSNLSKVVDSADLGATFAIMGVLESLTSIVGPTVYAVIYANTLDLFPGTLFLVMAGVSVIICCIDMRLLTHHPH